MDHAVRSAPRGRQTDPAADPEMVEGWGDGRRPTGGNGDRYSAGGGDFAAAGERVSAPRFRPLGGSLAEEGSARTGGCCPLRGRSGGGVSEQNRSRAFSERVSGKAGEVRSGASSGEDATAGVRPFCGRGPAQAGREETGDIHVPRIYPPMWNQSAGSVHGLASDGEQADGSEAEANKADAAPPDARAAEPDRGMAAECFAGLLSVPRCAGKPSGDERFSASAAADVAKHASSSKSAAQCQLGAPRPSL